MSVVSRVSSVGEVAICVSLFGRQRVPSDVFVRVLSMVACPAENETLSGRPKRHVKLAVILLSVFFSFFIFEVCLRSYVHLCRFLPRLFHGEVATLT